MNYNTETINGVAREIAEMFKAAVSEQQKAGQGTPKIAQIETDLREVLRQIGLQALGLFLSSMPSTPASEIACACGGTLRYQRKREAVECPCPLNPQASAPAILGWIR